MAIWIAPFLPAVGVTDALPSDLPSGPSSLASKLSGIFGGACQPQVRVTEDTPVRSTLSDANQPSPAGKISRLWPLYLKGLNPFVFSIPVKKSVLLRRLKAVFPVRALILLPPLSV